MMHKSNSVTFMVSRLPFISAVLAGLTVILVVVNAVLILNNQDAQAEVQQRQQVIAEAAQLNQVNTAILQQLGNAVLATNDEAIRALLAEFGYSVTPNETSQGAAP